MAGARRIHDQREGRQTMQAAHKTSAEKPEFSEYDYSNFYYGAGDDPLNLLRPYADWYREAALLIGGP